MSGSLDEYLDAQAAKSTLRFITCGSVDDGKSTLIGRLLYDSQLLMDDQLTTLEADSRKVGTQGGEIDFALLVDGLAAEREQGITIDVAYRYFATDRRKFVVADTPGHEQYTRNMATGASNAEAAVILVDARKGVQVQTRRHAYIVSLFGIRDIVLAVNKMDLVDYAESVFTAIVDEFTEFAGGLGGLRVTAIPVSALRGENITTPGLSMPWYTGAALLETLENLQPATMDAHTGFRMPVQWVNRPNLDFRGFSGTIAAGVVKPGDDIIALPSGARSSVREIVSWDGALDSAGAGDAVTLTLNDEIDVSRGDVLSSVIDPADVSDQFAVHVLWMTDDPLIPGRQYYFKTGTVSATATVTSLKHQINVNTLQPTPAKQLGLNEIGVANLSLNKRIAFDAFSRTPTLGSFILIDKLNYATQGAGLIDFALRRADNLVWQHTTVSKAARSEIKHQKPCVIWLTGLSGSGKSTIANLIENRLNQLHRHTYILDGDNVRHGLSRDLGFTEHDRVENIRRVAETARLMVDAGLITIVSFISPYASERRMARELFEADEFLEIYLDTPIEVCEQRDPKGLYQKARAGTLANFTGIDSAYEPPEHPELTLHTAERPAEACAEAVLQLLQQRRILDL